MLQKQYWLKVQFLVALLVVIEIVVSCERENTVKQGIIYWTCTGPAVEVIGLAPTRD